MESQNYKGLVAWQKAMALAESVYSISAVMPLEDDSG
jgi:hypothetical protein